MAAGLNLSHSRNYICRYSGGNTIDSRSRYAQTGSGHREIAPPVQVFVQLLQGNSMGHADYSTVFVLHTPVTTRDTDYHYAADGVYDIRAALTRRNWWESAAS